MEVALSLYLFSAHLSVSGAWVFVRLHLMPGAWVFVRLHLMPSVCGELLPIQRVSYVAYAQ